MKGHKTLCFRMARLLSLIVLLQVSALAPLVFSEEAEAVENRAGQKYDSIESRFRFAQEGTSMQLDMTYPLSMASFSNLEVYLHLQYVDTLAETLKNYEERTKAFRIGFSIVR